DPAGWASVRTVADIGGGTGAVLAEIVRAHPGVRGILVDLPRTVERSAAVFEAAGVADRAQAVGQSFFDTLPAGADVYLIHRVLNDWPDSEAAAILRRCAEAARPARGRDRRREPGRAGAAGAADAGAGRRQVAAAAGVSQARAGGGTASRRGGKAAVGEICGRVRSCLAR